MIEKIMLLSPLVIITLIRFFVPKAITNYYLLLPETKEEEEVCFEAKRKEGEEEVIIDDEEDDAGGNIWCKLDRDMLGEITKRLGVSDQARFRAVCKTWLLAAAAALAPQTSISNIYTQTKPLMLPWYVYYSRLVPTVSNTLELQIYYPSSSSSSSSSFHQIISLTKLGIPTPPCYRNIGITCHRNWFIINIAKHHKPRSFAKTRRYYFIYSFITKKIIKLPIFSFRPGCSFMRTFTTHDPRSPSCVFILLNAPITDSFVIVTCRKGDRVWTAREFPNIGRDAFLHCRCYPFFFGGMLYIVSPFGQLASYNILDGEFSFVNLGIDQLFALNFSLRRFEIFELNGELMIFYFGSTMKNEHTFPGNQCLKQFDWSSRVWIPVSSLGGKTLFVANKINSVAILSTEQMRCNGILSNKIYHFFDDQCTIYSLEDGNLVKFKSINLLEDGAGNLIAYKDNNNNNDVIPWGIPWDIEARLYLEPPVIVV